MAEEKLNIAIIGSGCAGLGALYGLRNSGHNIDLYEKDNRIGGHAHTVQVPLDKEGNAISASRTSNGEKPVKSLNVDSGFIVFNDINYPNFKAFLEVENVISTKTDMSLSVRRPSGYEWSGHGLHTIFSSPGSLTSGRTWRMVFDIARFNATALKALSTEDDGITLGPYLERNGYGEGFIHDYLLPMTAAVWSMPEEMCWREFPLKTLVRFLWNHHLLNTIKDRPKWRTVTEGSKMYVNAILDSLQEGDVGDRIRLWEGTGVVKVQRENSSWRVFWKDGAGEEDSRLYDRLIFATHAHQALSLLTDPNLGDQQSILANFQTSSNNVILHTDPTVMPAVRANWSAWNSLSLPGDSPPSLTYWMNMLQPHLPASPNLFITLNPPSPPPKDSIIRELVYDHPIYTLAAIKAQKQLKQIQGKDGLYFAGAWTKYGFHEDGFASGLMAAEKSGGQVPWGQVWDATEVRAVEESLGDKIVRMVLGGMQIWVGMLVWVFGGKEKKE